jgi:polyphosphate glucokinase
MENPNGEPTDEVMGIDVGGSGVKGGVVDLSRGLLLTDRRRIDTPEPATPAAVTEVISRLVAHFDWDGAVGVAIPAVVRHGIVLSAANIDDSWLGDDAEERFSAALGRPVPVLNDADAAGLAEVRYGGARGRTEGVVIVLTFGTGIGSAVFVEGRLVPNTELGHLELGGGEAEKWTSAKVRRREGLSWEDWGRRVGTYLRHVEGLFSPDLIIIGGGVSKRTEEFFPYLDTEAPVVAAELENRAGVVGAAWHASRREIRGDDSV